ncbi:MAG: hypothetical protein GDA41_06005 [Rhodospirillales bacterium]|nr:hypothetical protein [Rhodospirillales bacterium]
MSPDWIVAYESKLTFRRPSQISNTGPIEISGNAPPPLASFLPEQTIYLAN